MVKYYLAVQFKGEKNQIYIFKTEKQREKVIKELKKLEHEYATAESN